MTAPYIYPVDIEVWADREADLEALFRELHEEDARAEADLQQEPEGAA